MPQIRVYRPGDETGIRQLFETCHKRSLPADLWRWRYSGQPVTEVAAEAADIVGHISALRTPLERCDQTLTAGLLADPLVHPNNRNPDLFLEMAEAARRRAAEEGIDILLAFSDSRSFAALQHTLRWTHIGAIIPLAGPLAALRKPPPAHGITVAHFPDFDAEFDALWERVRPRQRWCFSRRAPRLSWRYFHRPLAPYRLWSARDASGKLVGWVSVKVFEGPNVRAGDILDLCAEPGPATDALLTTALRHFGNHSIPAASAWALDGTSQYAAFKELGLSPGAGPTHFAGCWTADGRPDFPGRLEDWSLEKGDSDFF